MLSAALQAVLRPHPPPCRLGATSRSGGYTHRLLPVTARPGPARASPVPVPTFCPSRSPYPGGFLSACTSRSSAPSMAFAVISAARHPLVPFTGVSLTRLQDSLHAAGWTVAPPKGALDAALQHRAFPPGTGSLLPGLLAATRTGLPPAGGHELARESPQRDHLLVIAVHPRCWAHETRARSRYTVLDRFQELTVGYIWPEYHLGGQVVQCFARRFRARYAKAVPGRHRLPPGWR
jgi:hypothetical protein